MRHHTMEKFKEPQVWLVVPDSAGNLMLVARSTDKDLVGAIYDRTAPDRRTEEAKAAWSQADLQMIGVNTPVRKQDVTEDSPNDTPRHRVILKSARVVASELEVCGRQLENENLTAAERRDIARRLWIYASAVRELKDGGGA